MKNAALSLVVLLAATACTMRSRAIPNEWTHSPVAVDRVRIVYERPDAHFIELGSVRAGTLSECRRLAARLGADAIWVHQRPFAPGSVVTVIKWLPSSVG